MIANMSNEEWRETIYWPFIRAFEGCGCCGNDDSENMKYAQEFATFVLDNPSLFR